MRADEAFKCGQQLVGMAPVTAKNCPIDIISDHSADLPTTVGLAKQTLRQSGRKNVWYVLMLRQRYSTSSLVRPHSPMQSSSEIMASSSHAGTRGHTRRRFF
jgi:hypothetical protein